MYVEARMIEAMALVDVIDDLADVPNKKKID